MVNQKYNLDTEAAIKNEDYATYSQQQFIFLIYFLQMSDKITSRYVLNTVSETERENFNKEDNNKLFHLYAHRRFTKRKLTSLESLKKMWNFKNLVSKMVSQIVLNYRPQYNFEEEWEKNDQDSEEAASVEETDVFLLKHTDRIYMFAQAIFMLVNILVAIYFSIKQIFNIPEFNKTFILGWIICTFLDIAVNANTTKIQQNRQIVDRNSILKIFLKEQLVYNLVNIVIGIIVLFCRLEVVCTIILIIIALAVLTSKIMNQYTSFKLLIIDLELNEYFKIIQIFAILMFLGHIFAIILYSSSFLSIENNWLTKYGIQHNAWTSKYIYSLYWAITTMVTVGFGDISPANQFEVMAVMMVEIFGTGFYGYMINIIGLALSDMRKQKQSLQQDLSILSKISKYFSLSKDLSFRIKNYIENNQKADSSYSIEQENRIREKLNPQLNNQIINETNTRIIKKCLYFLTYFTRNFQSQVAMKLIMKIFQPREFLDQTSLSTFIIEKGRVEVYYKKKLKNKSVYKTLRMIKQGEVEDSVNLNVFGYTKTILGKQMNLNAKTTTFTVAYELTRKYFMEVLQNNPLDYEMYCHLRDSIAEKQNPESIEGPILTNSRKHYCPNKFILLKKYCYSKKQIRNPKCRRPLKRFKALMDCTNTTGPYNEDGQLHSCMSQDIPVEQATKQITKTFKKMARSIDKTPTPELPVFEYDFDICKNFDNYMKSNNFKQILKKYSQFVEKNKTVEDSVITLTQ